MQHGETLPRLNAFRLRRLSIENRISSTGSTPCRILAPFSYWQQRQASTSKDISANDARPTYVHGTWPLSLFIAHSIASCPNAPPIINIIIPTVCTHISLSLGLLRHWFRRDSTLLFLQRGMDILDELYEGIFKNVQTRPNCLNAMHSWVHSLNFYFQLCIPSIICKVEKPFL